MAQWIKNLPARQETQEIWVQSLDWEDPLEKENGHPFQHSCLKNPTDRGVWAAAQRVIQSRTQPSTKRTQGLTRHMFIVPLVPWIKGPARQSWILGSGSNRLGSRCQLGI